MRLTIITCTLCLFILNGCKEKIDNKVTSEHLYLQFAPIAIIPPQQFYLTNEFSGFEIPLGFLKVETYEYPVKQVKMQFSKDALEKNGITKLSEKPVSINGREGYRMTLLDSNQNIAFHKEILLLGDKFSATVLNGLYPRDSSHYQSALENALNSVVYTPDWNIGERSAYFKLVSDTLKIAEVSNAGVTLSNTGKSDLATTELFLLGQVLVEHIPEPLRVPTVRNTFKEIDSLVQKSIHGYPAIEAIELDSNRMLLVTYLFGENITYRYYGAARHSYSQSVDILREQVLAMPPRR
jgi:hypothetical protein